MDLIDRNAVLKLPRNVTKNLSGEVIEETIDVDRIKKNYSHLNVLLIGGVQIAESMTPKIIVVHGSTV